MTRFLLAFALGVSLSAACQAQQTVLGVNHWNFTNSFYENFNVGFGFNLPGGGNVVGLLPNGQPTPNGELQFRQNNFAPPPPFGGYTPNADATLGFRVGGLFFNIAASQGSSTTAGSQSASVTLPNGGTGGVFDTIQRPFVTGLVPVVGEMNHLPIFPSQPMAVTSPLRERLARLQAGELGTAAESGLGSSSAAGAAAAGSTANRGDLGVREIEAAQAAERALVEQELEALVERARGAEEAGKLGAARVYYRMAADRAQGDRRTELLSRWRSLER